MKKFFISISILSMVCFLTDAGFSDEYWVKGYGGVNQDHIYAIQEVQGGGYIMVGQTRSFNDINVNAWVLKLDDRGNVLWVKEYGGDNDDHATSIEQTSDGGYIVAGKTSSFGAGSGDFLILKLNIEGNVSWARTYGGNSFEYARSIQQTSDGGYIIAGYTESFGAIEQNALVLKLTNDGDISWSKMYGGSRDDYAKSIQQTLDGGYIVAIDTNSFGTGEYDHDFWVLKLNSDGDIVWQKTYGSSNLEQPSSILQTTDGGYIMAGIIFPQEYGGCDIWILRLDSNGEIFWQKTYGLTHSVNAFSLQQTSDGGYIVAGASRTGQNTGTEDLLVFKLDPEGIITWQKTFGGDGADTGGDFARSVQQISDGGYVVAGYTPSFGAGRQDGWILKLNNMGEIPNCEIMNNSTLTTSNTSVVGQNVDITVQSPTVTVNDVVITSLDISPEMSVICCYDSIGFDDDCDEILNENDNCPLIYNPDQEDADSDEIGDVCDNCPVVANFNQADTDNDGIGDLCDNCPLIFNPDQEDMDSDMVGDVCDDDLDGDGILNNEDNCSEVYNPNQKDVDDDGIGDICDSPKGLVVPFSGATICMHTITHLLINPCDESTVALLDNFSSGMDLDDYLGNYVEVEGYDVGLLCYIVGVETITLLPDPTTDTDGDEVGDVCDNCPLIYNPDQEDSDEDELGDICDWCTDIDRDGYGNPGFAGSICILDNCPDISNPNQSDVDGDCLGDVCDADPNDPNNPSTLVDADDDGIGDTCDNCPTIPDPNQEDIDKDGVGDLCDNCLTLRNPHQYDTYPPQGNGIGDACDCECDFNCDGNVDASDVTSFLTDFGRNEFNDPCTNESPCYGDVDCSGNCDATDVTAFLEDFGRNQFNDPCPACEAGNWCVYP